MPSQHYCYKLLHDDDDDDDDKTLYSISRRDKCPFLAIPSGAHGWTPQRYANASLLLLLGRVLKIVKLC